MKRHVLSPRQKNRRDLNSWTDTCLMTWRTVTQTDRQGSSPGITMTSFSLFGLEQKPSSRSECLEGSAYTHPTPTPSGPLPPTLTWKFGLRCTHWPTGGAVVGFHTVTTTGADRNIKGFINAATGCWSLSSSGYLWKLWLKEDCLCVDSQGF